MYNKYAELRRRYLRTHKSGIYTGMLLTDKLDAHLKVIGAEALEMLDRLIEQMRVAECVTEQLKSRKSNGMDRSDEQHTEPC